MLNNKFTFTKINRTSVFGRFNDLDWNSIATLLDNWEPGQKGTIEIKKESKPKSPEQLGYYYAVILPAAFDDFKQDHGVTLTITLKDKTMELPLSLKSVDWFFKLNYAQYNHGEYKDKAEMTMSECAAFETYVIKWLYTWRNVHVPLSNPDWRNDV